MTAKEQVLDLLRQEQQEDTKVAKAARRKEWEGALRELFLQFEEWLKEVVDRGLLTVSTEPTILKEKKLGPPLSAQRLVVVTPGNVKFTITPKARYLAGAKGRVDFERRGKRFKLVRNASRHWEFKKLRAKSEELSEKAFWDCIWRLIS